MLFFTCDPQNPTRGTSGALSHLREPPLLLSASGEHVASKSLGLCSTRQLEHHHRQPQKSPFNKMSYRSSPISLFFPKNPALPEFCGLLKSTAVRSEHLIQQHYNLSICAEVWFPRRQMAQKSAACVIIYTAQICWKRRRCATLEEETRPVVETANICAKLTDSFCYQPGDQTVECPQTAQAEDSHYSHICNCITPPKK